MIFKVVGWAMAFACAAQAGPALAAKIQCVGTYGGSTPAKKDWGKNPSGGNLPTGTGKLVFSVSNPERTKFQMRFGRVGYSGWCEILYPRPDMEFILGDSKSKYKVTIFSFDLPDGEYEIKNISVTDFVYAQTWEPGERFSISQGRTSYIGSIAIFSDPIPLRSKYLPFIPQPDGGWGVAIKDERDRDLGYVDPSKLMELNMDYKILSTR